MKSIKTVRIPVSRNSGAVDWADLREFMQAYHREILAGFDPRNPDNDFAGGLVANGTGGVTLGASAVPTGRTVGIPTLFTWIGDTGRAADQRFFPQVAAGNRLSAQSANPLSATSGPSTSTISIAAHTVQYGFGTVSYNSGSITGLTPNTAYFVYADDANFAGGAVSYAATTSAQTVVASNARYYVGQIVTPVSSSSSNVSAATNANPCAITTSTAHGFTTGNQVTFASVGGMTNLNGNTYTITVTGTTTFTLNSTDSTAYGVYTSGGTVTRVSTGSSGYEGGGGWGWAIP